MGFSTALINDLVLTYGYPKKTGEYAIQRGTYMMNELADNDSCLISYNNFSSYKNVLFNIIPFFCKIIKFIAINIK